jgi:hypothetical protein
MGTSDSSVTVGLRQANNTELAANDDRIKWRAKKRLWELLEDCERSAGKDPLKISEGGSNTQG